jgi:hypothetical protein
MSALAAACDVASAVGSACANASPLPAGPTVAQWSNDVHQAGKDLISSYFDNGPVAWLGLLITLAVFRKVFGFFAFILLPNRKDPK